MRSLAFGRAVLVSVAASAAAVAMAACHTSANTPALTPVPPTTILGSWARHPGAGAGVGACA